jgi:two-component system response regulator GlrR
MNTVYNSVLVVDDDPILRLMIRLVGWLRGHNGCQCRAGAHESAWRDRASGDRLADVGMDGMALFEAVRGGPALPVIILTAHGSIPDAVAAVKQGVFGYLTKPFDAKALLAEVERAVAVSGGSAATQGQASGEEWRRNHHPQPRQWRTCSKARLVAGSDVASSSWANRGPARKCWRAIMGEPRRDNPFVAINCGAIPKLLGQTFRARKGLLRQAMRTGPLSARQGHAAARRDRRHARVVAGEAAACCRRGTVRCRRRRARTSTCA